MDILTLLLLVGIGLASIGISVVLASKRADDEAARATRVTQARLVEIQQRRREWHDID